MKSVTRLGLFCLAPIFVTLLTVGCSSSSKKSETTANRAEPQINSDGSETPATSGAPSAPISGVEKKYQSLAQAVRAAQPKAISDEAAKILASNPNDPTALNALGLFHLRRGRIGAAKLLFARALEKNPPTASLENNLGVALLQEGDQGGAVAQFKKALRLDPSHSEALGNLGSIFMSGGDATKALPLLEQSYKANRTNAAVANNYAIALRTSGNLEGAAKIYDSLIKQNSKDVAAHLNYAILLIDFMNKPKDGLELVYKVKFLETGRKDVLAKANALEKKAKAGVQ